MEFAPADWEEETTWTNEVALAIAKVKETEKQTKRPASITYYVPQPKVKGTRANYTVQYFLGARKQARDTTKHIPTKRFETHPMAFMGPGLLGFTYLWHDFMVVRDNLRENDMHEEVYVHEAIHTEDEYETTVLAKWMVDATPGDYEELPPQERQTEY